MIDFQYLNIRCLSNLPIFSLLRCISIAKLFQEQIQEAFRGLTRQGFLFDEFKINSFMLFSVYYYSDLMKSGVKFSCGYYSESVFSCNWRYRIPCIFFFTDFIIFFR